MENWQKWVNSWRNKLREKCPYLEFFWSEFSHIWTEYEEILHISPYSVEMQESTDQKFSRYWYFLRSDNF